MKTFWITFVVWAVILTAVTVFVNMPTDRDSSREAGWPCPFAISEDHKPAFFDNRALMVDVELGAAIVLVFSYACAAARRRRWEQDEKFAAALAAVRNRRRERDEVLIATLAGPAEGERSDFNEGDADAFFRSRGKAP